MSGIRRTVARVLEGFLKLQDAPSSIIFNEEKFFWAMRNLPIEEAVKHLLIIGTTGSGKTTAIELFLQSIAPRFRNPERPEQLIIFDGKGDIVPFLSTLGYSPDHPDVWILNPYDERSAVWNIAHAAEGPLRARAFAALLVPEEKNSTAPFFSNAARRLVFAVIAGLEARSPGAWSFRDLLCALDSEEHILAVASHHPRGRRIAKAILTDAQHSKGVVSQLASKLGDYEEVAALWHTSSGRPFSIPRFLERPGVLIIGDDPVLRPSLWPLNALLLRALGHEILRKPNISAPDSPRHWFVLDEFRAMEKVDSIYELLNRGRSKGVSILLGVQSVSGLKDVYDENRANDILGLCTTKCFLRVGDPPTDQWICSYLGTERRTEGVVTESYAKSGDSSSIQYQEKDRPIFIPGFFNNLPMPKISGRYVMVSDIPALHQAIIFNSPFETVQSWRVTADSSVPALVPRDSLADQTLWPWDAAEEAFFCEKPLPSILHPSAPLGESSQAAKLPKRQSS